MELTGKIALVTGASKGIGAAAAIALAREGCTVFINYKADEQSAQAVLAECNKHSQGNRLAQADVSDEGQVAAMFERVRGGPGRLDVLVNNAGIFDEEDSPTNVEAFGRVFHNNLLSCVLAIKHALPLMQEGKVVNVSSIHGRFGHGRPEAAAYAACKAALENYTANLAKQVAPNILVNAIAPGRVATAMWGEPDAAQQQELGQVHLIKRMIQPDEVADGIVFLCKNDALCGSVLTIDGGMGLVTLG